MKDKFTMSLVWHNCKTCPPNEEYNSCLYVTKGGYIFKAVYYGPDAWINKENNCHLPYDELHKYWWADIIRTVATSQEFIDAREGD